MIDVRDRLSEGVNRSRLQLEAKRSLRPLAVVVAGLLAALAMLGFIVTQVSPTAFSDTYEVALAMDDVTGIQPNVNEVRLSGIPVGSITKVEADGTQPVVTLKIKKKYGRVYRDAKVELRPNTPLQDMYVDIVKRGTPRAGELDTKRPLAAARTQTPVPLQDVLNVFRGDERAHLAALVDNLGNGLDDRGAALRTAFAELTPTLEAVGRLTDELAVRRRLVKRIVHNTGVVTRELASRDDQLRDLVYTGSQTVKTLQGSGAQLDATLRALPPTLSRVDTTMAAVDGVIPAVDGAVRSLYPVAEQLPASLSALRRLSDTARPAVHSLRSPVRRLAPLARTLVPLSASLDTTVRRLRPQTGAIDHTTKAAAGCEKGIQGFFQWNASISKFGDARGLVPRGNVVIGGSTGVRTPDEFAPQSCTPGAPIGGRPARPGEGH